MVHKLYQLNVSWFKYEGKVTAWHTFWMTEGSDIFNICHLGAGCGDWNWFLLIFDFGDKKFHVNRVLGSVENSMWIEF